MRLRYGFLLAFLVACGGNVATPIENDDRVPATPFPDEQTEPSSGPTGFVTLFSIEGHLVITPSFFAERTPASTAPTSECSVDRADRARPKEVSAGTLTFTLPLRSGPDSFNLLFDRTEGRYEFKPLDNALLEPGGVIRVAAKGDVAPAFDEELRMAANIAFDLPASGGLALDANAPRDLPLHWTTEGDNDEVFANIIIGDNSVTCWFDSRAGSGTVPAALVADLVKDAPAECEKPTCMLFLASKRLRTVAVGEWTMVLAHGFAVLEDVRVTR